MSCEISPLENIKCEFADAVYTKYLQIAFGINSCKSDYSQKSSEEMKLKIDQLSFCNAFRCNNPQD